MARRAFRIASTGSAERVRAVVKSVVEPEARNEDTPSESEVVIIVFEEVD